MSVDEAIRFLKQTVKFSDVPGQKHLDVTLVQSEERDTFYQAMGIVKKAIHEGDLSESEFSSRVGLE